MKKENSEKTKKRIICGSIYIALAVTVVAITTRSINNIMSGGNKLKAPNFDLESKQSKDEQKIGKLEIPNLDEKYFFIEDDDTEVLDTEKNVEATNEDLNNQKLSTQNTEIIDEPSSEPSGEQLTGEPCRADDTNVSAEIEYPTDPEYYSIDAPFIKPVDGYICREFSPQELIYSQTMYDYRTHSGIDLASELGEKVRAFANGTITEIYEDAMFGTCVVIDHGEGLTSRYMNLYEALPADMVIGKQVLVGDVIAGVGESAICEIADVPHLHFQVEKDGIVCDPSEYYR